MDKVLLVVDLVEITFLVLVATGVLVVAVAAVALVKQDLLVITETQTLAAVVEANTLEICMEPLEKMVGLLAVAVVTLDECQFSLEVVLAVEAEAEDTRKETELAL